jgi:hypothetical protein
VDPLVLAHHVAGEGMGRQAGPSLAGREERGGCVHGEAVGPAGADLDGDDRRVAVAIDPPDQGVREAGGPSLCPFDIQRKHRSGRRVGRDAILADRDANRR